MPFRVPTRQSADQWVWQKIGMENLSKKFDFLQILDFRNYKKIAFLKNSKRFLKDNIFKMIYLKLSFFEVKMFYKLSK